MVDFNLEKDASVGIPNGRLMGNVGHAIDSGPVKVAVIIGCAKLPLMFMPHCLSPATLNDLLCLDLEEIGEI